MVVDWRILPTLSEEVVTKIAHRACPCAAAPMTVTCVYVEETVPGDRPADADRLHGGNAAGRARADIRNARVRPAPAEVVAELRLSVDRARQRLEARNANGVLAYVSDRSAATG